jgi:GTP-binding protein
MKITQAEFISSVADIQKGPQDDLPEYAFIGRSNVGKSSLINMLTGRKALAKTSSTPGKTQTINHFRINNQWYLVDLPGYGHAKVSKDVRAGFGKIIEHYVLKSKKLQCLFVLIDIRLEPQANDLSFIQWAGEKEIPLAIIFTKCDKVSRNKVHVNRKLFENALLQSWEELPPMFLTSATDKSGKEDVLNFIEQALLSQA